MIHSHITSFIWSVADLIRNMFKCGKYQDVILPLTVLRRIDQVLEPTKGKVRKAPSEFKGKVDNPDNLLRKVTDYAFNNTSLCTFAVCVATITEPSFVASDGCPPPVLKGPGKVRGSPPANAVVQPFPCSISEATQPGLRT